MNRLAMLVLAMVANAIAAPPEAPEAIAKEIIVPLIAPSKLATLGERGANQRVQKITAILWQLKVSGHDPAKVARDAVELIGWGGTP